MGIGIGDWGERDILSVWSYGEERGLMGVIIARVILFGIFLVKNDAMSDEED